MRRYNGLKASILVLLLVFAFSCSVMAEPVKIKFATWSGVKEAEQLQKIVDEINARHDDFQIETIHIPGDYYTKIMVMIAGGTPPDIFYLSQEYVPDYASKWVLMNLTNVLKQDKDIDLDDYYPEALKTSEYKGQLYGLPWIYQPFILYYNKDLFDKFDVEYPESNMTWDEFVEVAKRMTRDVDGDGKNDYWGYIQQGTPEIWIWQAGGRIVNNAATRSLLDKPEAIEGISFFNDLIHKHKITPPMSTVSEQGFAEMFKSGKIAMFFGGAADGFYDVDFNVGTAELPVGQKKATFAWTASLVISSATEHKRLAYEAWKELLDGIQHWKIAPPRKSLMSKLQEIEPRLSDNRAEVIRNSMQYARGFNNVVGQGQIQQAFWEKLSLPIWLGEKEPARAAKETADKMNQILDEYSNM